MNAKEGKQNVIMQSVVYIVLGVLLLVWHDAVTKTIGYMIGCVLLMLGGALIFSYISRKEALPDGGNNFVIGGLLAVFGVMTLIKVEDIIGLLPVAMGIFIVVSGLQKMQQAIDLYRMQTEGVFGNLIFSLLTLVLGSVLLINPFDSVSMLIMILGIGLLFCGITDIVIGLRFYSMVKKYTSEEKAIIVEGKEKE